MKILHVPTAHPKVLEAVINPHQTNETTMALLYAVCFVATATIPKQETKEQLGFERLTLLRYLMHRLDASLTKAKVLMYPNVEALQALVIYLVATTLPLFYSNIEADRPRALSEPTTPPAPSG